MHCWIYIRARRQGMNQRSGRIYSATGMDPTVHTRAHGKYESPQEFLAHLMSLAADKDHNKVNCGCIICKGSGQLDKRTPTPPPQVASGAEPAKVPVTATTTAAPVPAMAALLLLQQQQESERDTVAVGSLNMEYRQLGVGKSGVHGSHSIDFNCDIWSVV
ncbi:hypothetical protein BGX38DRAFT_261048 [Terfezia claveryi]|nr:hypothetical protein BGX38DRAFT_261048 [Terfezia claveryi]